ncbi:GSCOCG00006369001-RA-CDS [Cotesia congregata]|uniref:Similar to Actr10: Actin-related protein 10 (Mus musculus) n=1 Tax=Cotesia congregata TaxID=51543 RepID=A0A8J2HEY0_COTCN|nr:GSCOCG00006369001-RA-CDS [Cotesia congregata]CAG5096279.1 Similar to Actr10: Actin-related protein 10 (Mus musculus) [Cotesia congregata]
MKMSRPYEGIRYTSEKQVVVLDIGSAYTKFGYAGEGTPRGIVRTEVKCSDTKQMRKIYKYIDTDDLYQLLVEFFHVIFFRHVVITPKDVKVLILESLLTPSKFRDTMAKVLFRHFEIGSLMILPTHLVTISTLGWDTALVLDVGYQDATLIPIYKGVPVLKAWQSLPLASEAIHERIKNDMKEAIPEVELTERVIEDIKVRTCFVTTLERSKKLGTDDAPAPPPSVKYPGLKTIEIPGYVRERSYELLWERDADNLSIPTMILDAILKCSIMTRHELAENILLIGGTTMAKGFAARLKSELTSLVASDLYSNKLKIPHFKFHTAPCKPNYTAWLGGAIFGITDLPSRCITKDTYLKTNRIPDWVNLIDNQKELGSNYGV